MGLCMHLDGVTCDNCRRYYQPYYVPYVPQPTQIFPMNQPIKCGLCGSTAIDHTEAECLRNRQLKPTAPTDKKGKKANK